MLLCLENTTVPMKQVYMLSEELKNNQERVAKTQRLTLDSSRPLMGLKGVHGLFASDEWWASIQERRMPLLFLSGVINRAYFAGQDEPGINNTVDLIMSDNSIRAEGIYTNNEDDVKFFCIGHRVDIVYALDELKKQPGEGGGKNYSDIVLEMAISEEPV